VIDSPALVQEETCLHDRAQSILRQPVGKSMPVLLCSGRPGEPGNALLRPVLATFDLKASGDWISSRIVKRFHLEYLQARDHREVPPLEGRTFERTRIYVDLSCGKKSPAGNSSCQHRFYVVNNFVHDILVGSELCAW